MPVQYVESLDRIFHALGDGTRREMLGLLARRGDCTAGELGEPFNIAQPTASRHLRVLESAGLVGRRVSGRVHRFRIQTKPLQQAQGWIEKQRAFWEASFNQLDKYLEDVQEKERKKNR